MHCFEGRGMRFIMSDLYSQGTTGSMTFISIAAGTTGTEGTCSSSWEIRMNLFKKKKIPFLLRAISGRHRYLLWGHTMSAVHSTKTAFLLSLLSVHTAASKNFTCILRDAHMYQESTAVGFKKCSYALQIQILFYVIYLIFH